MQYLLHRILLFAADSLDLNHRGGRLFLEHVLAVERGHPLVLFSLLLRLGLSPQLLFARRLRNAGVVEIVLLAGCDGFRIEDEAMLLARQRDVLAAGEDLMSKNTANGPALP